MKTRSLLRSSSIQIKSSPIPSSISINALTNKEILALTISLNQFLQKNNSTLKHELKCIKKKNKELKDTN